MSEGVRQCVMTGHRIEVRLDEEDCQPVALACELCGRRWVIREGVGGVHAGALFLSDLGQAIGLHLSSVRDDSDAPAVRLRIEGLNGDATFVLDAQLIRSLLEGLPEALGQAYLLTLDDKSNAGRGLGQ